MNIGISPAMAGGGWSLAIHAARLSLNLLSAL
jgi:hypothetical protein